MRVTFALLIIWAAAVCAPSGTQGNSIEFGDLKCKLPGWPGHPAPSCDPQVPNQCCAGTKCLPDPFDENHNTCQQINSVSMAERALTASVLTSRVENLLGDAVSMLNLASTSLYLAGNEPNPPTVNNEAILERAKSLTANHGNVKTGSKDSKDSKDSIGEDWHKYAHGGSPSKNNMRNAVENKKDSPAPAANGQAQGGFDYSQYYGGTNKGSGGSSGGGAQQGGFDYSKYMPKNIPNKDADGKKDAKKKDTKSHNLEAEDVAAKAKDADNELGYHRGADKPSKDEKEHGGYDYSPYYPIGGDPHKRGSTRTFAPVRDDDDDPAHPPTANHDSGNSGFDYSQYWPVQKGKTMALQGEDGDDFIRRAALELLEADAQARVASVQARRAVLERARVVLARLQARIDLELAQETNANPSYTSNRATESPTVVWNDPRDPWSKYIPNMPNYGPPNNNNNNNDQKGGSGVKYNSGDRRPGSLGGPCGQTSYKDFGPCQSKDLTCEGLDAQRPGLCQMRKSDAVVLSRSAALDSLRLAEEASRAIQAAAVELIVGSVQPGPITQDAASVAGADPATGTAQSPNENAMDIRGYSSTTVVVVLLGFAVLGYFCWMSVGKRSSYQRIDTPAATGAGWGSRA